MWELPRSNDEGKELIIILFLNFDVRYFKVLYNYSVEPVIEDT